MMERKCFVCGGFGHITHNCKNMENRGEEGSILMPSNKFEVLKSRVMNVGEGSGREIEKDRKTILREERLKKEKLMEVQKIGAENSSSSVEKKEKLLREVTVKIILKQEEDEEGIVVEVLSDSGVTGLVMSSEFARKNKFRKKELDKLIYVRNVDGTFNHEELIEYIVEIELFNRGYKERMEIDVIGEQKWSVILEMLWLVYHNPEIDWKIREIKMMRCPDKCEKQWKTKQMKLGWQKQKQKKKKKEKRQREKKKEFRKQAVEEEIEIARMIEEKQEEEDLIEIRMVEKMVPRRLYKHLKIFEKEESEWMLMRKTWDHAIDLKKEFVPKKGNIYLLSRMKREEVQEFVKDQLRKGYI